jgi:16S rRNA (guanine966-N2)-methyltransferase
MRSWGLTSSQGSYTVRIISGKAKGRKLASVPGSTTRPITDRVKSALFSILGGDVADSTWLDLFAGTGSVGMEALSRGASSVIFVDRVRKAIETIHRNLDHIGLLEHAELAHDDAFRFLRRAEPDLTFDYIYVAPPQYQDLWAKVLQMLDEKPMLNEDGMIIVQIHPKEFHELATPHLELVDERRYGSTVLKFYTLKNVEAIPESPSETATAVSEDGAAGSAGDATTGDPGEIAAERDEGA